MKLVSQKTTSGLKGHLRKNDKASAMGDKSISHRALMFAGMARGVSRISGLLESEDTERTQKTMEALGVAIKKDGDDYSVDSPGFLAFRQPQEPLNMGNSGTSARLLMGLLSGTGHQIEMIGDASLSKRPMQRIIDPLTNMGVAFKPCDVADNITDGKSKTDGNSQGKAQGKTQGNMDDMNDGKSNMDDIKNIGNPNQLHNKPSRKLDKMHDLHENLHSIPHNESDNHSARNNVMLPLSFAGQPPLIPIDYSLPVASAQIKSAILLAGLSAVGDTTVWENNISRDHTERMLTHFGIALQKKNNGNKHGITISGGIATLEKMTARNITVPRDISSVAFLLVAASILPNSDLTIEQVGLNPTRDGIIETLLEMGADIKIDYDGFAADTEPTATLRVRSAELHGVTTDAMRAPRMIDEYPILAIAAAAAHGTSLFRGLQELRVKESDRLTAMATGLSQAGVEVKSGDDWLEITGMKKIMGGNIINTNLDHRIAMSFYILGLISQNPITIDDGSAIATSFPNFLPLLTMLLDG